MDKSESTTNDGDLNQVESMLEEVADKNNLSATNVKSILKHLIMDDQVVSFLKSCVDDRDRKESANNYKSNSSKCKEDSNKLLNFAKHLFNDFQPKMTRSKIKELKNKGALCSVWPVSPPHLNQSPNYITKQQAVKFGDVEFPSDTEESDEEFQCLSNCISNNKGVFTNMKIGEDVQNSKVVNIKNQSPKANKDANASGSDLYFMDHDWTSASGSPSDTESENDCRNESISTVNMEEDKEHKEYRSWLNGIFSNDSLSDSVATYSPLLRKKARQRTRPRTSGNNFTLPAKSPTCVRKSVQESSAGRAVHEIGAISPVTTLRSGQNLDDEEEDDPEYDLMAELENFTEDPEDLRNDRAVHVSRKELNELLNELFEDDSNDSTNEDNVRLREKYQNMVPLECNELIEKSTSDQEPSVRETVPLDLSLYKMSYEELCQFKDQMRKHVQLLTQVYLLSCENQTLYPVKEVARVYLRELDKLASIHRTSEAGSSFNAVNLADAMEIIGTDRDRVQLKYRQPLSNRKRSANDPRKRQVSVQTMDAMVNCRAFMYPELLPSRGWRLDFDPFALNQFWHSRKTGIHRPVIERRRQLCGSGQHDKATTAEDSGELPCCSCGSHTLKRRRRRIRDVDREGPRPFRSQFLPAEEGLLATGLSYWFAGSFLTAAAHQASGSGHHGSKVGGVARHRTDRARHRDRATLSPEYEECHFDPHCDYGALTVLSTAALPFGGDMCRVLVRALTEPKCFPGRAKGSRLNRPGQKSRVYKLVHDLLMPCKSYLTIAARVRTEAAHLVDMYPAYFRNETEDVSAPRGNEDTVTLERMVAENFHSPIRHFLLTGRGPTVPRYVYEINESLLQTPLQMLSHEPSLARVPDWLVKYGAGRFQKSGSGTASPEPQKSSNGSFGSGDATSSPSHGKMSDDDVSLDREMIPSSPPAQIDGKVDDEAVVTKMTPALEFNDSKRTRSLLATDRSHQIKIAKAILKKYAAYPKPRSQAYVGGQAFSKASDAGTTGTRAPFFGRLKGQLDGQLHDGGSLSPENGETDANNEELPCMIWDQPRQLRTRHNSANTGRASPSGVRVRARRKKKHIHHVSPQYKCWKKGASPSTSNKSAFRTIVTKYQSSKILKLRKNVKDRKSIKKPVLRDAALSLEGKSGQPPPQNDLVELLKASSTVGFVPKGLSQIKLKRLNRDRKSYEETIELIRSNLLESDPLKQEKELAIAKCYMGQVKKALGEGSESYNEFLSILISCPDVDAPSVCKIYDKVSRLLSHRPELLAAFSIFLPLETLIPSHNISRNIVMTNVRIFLRKLEIYLAKTPGFYRKTIRRLNAWRLSAGTLKELLSIFSSCVKGNAYLTSEMHKLFPDLSPPKFNCQDEDFEVIDLTTFKIPASQKRNHKKGTSSCFDEEDNASFLDCVEEELDLDFEDLTHLLRPAAKHQTTNMYSDFYNTHYRDKAPLSLIPDLLPGAPASDPSAVCSSSSTDPRHPNKSPNALTGTVQLSVEAASQSTNESSANRGLGCVSNNYSTSSETPDGMRNVLGRSSSVKDGTIPLKNVQIFKPFSITRTPENMEQSASATVTPLTNPTNRSFKSFKIIHGKMKEVSSPVRPLPLPNDGTEPIVPNEKIEYHQSPPLLPNDIIEPRSRSLIPEVPNCPYTLVDNVPVTESRYDGAIRNKEIDKLLLLGCRQYNHLPKIELHLKLISMIENQMGLKLPLLDVEENLKYLETLYDSIV